MKPWRRSRSRGSRPRSLDSSTVPFSEGRAFRKRCCLSPSDDYATVSCRGQLGQPGLGAGRPWVDACLGGGASEERRSFVQPALVARRILLLFSIQGEGER